jgi:hypothetical protein
MADGGPSAGRWITFRDLSKGSLSGQAFEVFGPGRLAGRWRYSAAGWSVASRPKPERPVPDSLHTDLGCGGAHRGPCLVRGNRESSHRRPFEHRRHVEGTQER